MPSDIASLIARVEAAEGPDRELDAAIAVAAKQVPYDFEPASIGVASWRAKYDNRWWDCPEYTASLDAAMTLVPDGWRWRLELCQSGKVLAHLFNPDGTREYIRSGQTGNQTEFGSTPALALTAAALRAMQDQAK